MHNFLCLNIPIFPLNILPRRRIDTFWTKAIEKIWSGGIGTIWTQRIIQ